MKYKKTKYSDIKDSFLVANKTNIRKSLLKNCLYGLVVIVLLLAASTINDLRKGDASSEQILESISNTLIPAIIVGLFVFIVMSISLLKYLKSPIGIHEKGIWIHRGIGDEHIGFIEWGLIKDIQVSQNQEIVYVSLYDLNSFIKSNVNALNRFSVKKFQTAKGSDGTMALKIPFDEFSPILNDCIKCILENEFVEIYIIE